MNLWRDLTTDYRTQHYVAKDVFKAVAFVAGLGIVVFAAWADYRASRQVGLDGAVLLLTFAFGVQAAKAVEGYYNRKTATDAGVPLAQAGTAEAPATPSLMPQPETPPGPPTE